jgi:Mce-associated membrane protein
MTAVAATEAEAVLVAEAEAASVAVADVDAVVAADDLSATEDATQDDSAADSADDSADSKDGSEDRAPESTHEGAPGAAQPPVASRGFLAGRGPLLAVVLVCVVLAGLGAWQGWRLHTLQVLQSDRAAATAATERLAVSLTTISARSSEQDIKNLLDGTTGSLKDQIAQSSDSLSQVLQTNGVTSTGTVVQTGVISLADAKASVLVAVDASVTSTTASAVLRHYRMRASVTKVGDRWLVSDMAFVP